MKGRKPRRPRKIKERQKPGPGEKGPNRWNEEEGTFDFPLWRRQRVTLTPLTSIHKRVGQGALYEVDIA